MSSREVACAQAKTTSAKSDLSRKQGDYDKLQLTHMYTSSLRTQAVNHFEFEIASRPRSVIVFHDDLPCGRIRQRTAVRRRMHIITTTVARCQPPEIIDLHGCRFVIATFVVLLCEVQFRQSQYSPSTGCPSPTSRMCPAYVASTSTGHSRCAPVTSRSRIDGWSPYLPRPEGSLNRNL